MARAEVKVTLKDVPEVKALIERLTERAEAAEAAIERVLARCETAGTTQPPFGQPARTLTVAEIRAALDGTEATS